MNIYKIQYYLLKSKYCPERFAFSQSVLFILSFHNSKKKKRTQDRNVYEHTLLNVSFFFFPLSGC